MFNPERFPSEREPEAGEPAEEPAEEPEVGEPEREVERARFEGAFLPELKKATIETYADEVYAKAHHLNSLTLEQKRIEAADEIVPEIKYNDNGTVNNVNYAVRFNTRNAKGKVTSYQDYLPDRNRTWNAFMKAEQASGSKKGATVFHQEMLRKKMEENEQGRQYAQEQIRYFEQEYRAEADPKNTGIEQASAKGNELFRAKKEWEKKFKTHQQRNAGLDAEIRRWQISR